MFVRITFLIKILMTLFLGYLIFITKCDKMHVYGMAFIALNYSLCSLSLSLSFISLCLLLCLKKDYLLLFENVLN